MLSSFRNEGQGRYQNSRSIEQQNSTETTSRGNKQSGGGCFQQAEIMEVGSAETNPTTLRINRINYAKKNTMYSVRSNKNIELKALLDTGSPVSLIKYSIFKKYFASKELFKVKHIINLKGVNNSIIRMMEKIHDQIILKHLPDSWLKYLANECP